MSEQVQQEGAFKIKRKPKQLVKDDIIKVDLSKKQEELFPFSRQISSIFFELFFLFHHKNHEVF